MGTQRSAMAHDVHGALGDLRSTFGSAHALVPYPRRPALFFIALTLPFLGPSRALRLRHPPLDDLLVGHDAGGHQGHLPRADPGRGGLSFHADRQGLQAYVDKDMLLIIGMSMMTAAWARWGFARRIGLHFLSLVGNNVQAQTVAWFWLCGVVSFVVANTPVGAIFAPVAVQRSSTPDTRASSSATRARRRRTSSSR